MKKILIIATSLVLAFVVFLNFTAQPTKAAGFDWDNLISDGNYLNTDKMDTAAIQRFLVSKGSYLKDFSENGRSAAQIIRDASHGLYDAAGSLNGIAMNSSTGTINPEAILVTLQKEQSLVTRAERNDSALNTAMGYACPDSGGCNPTYLGFTKQVENGAWQLRYNYERAQGRGFGDYQVGQSFTFDDWNGTHSGNFGNKATASLYRYTPHVYNGNYNFWNLMTTWFSVSEFSAQSIGQSNYPTVNAGATQTMTISYRNTGSATWTRGTVNLGTVNPNYTYRTNSYPLAESWASSDRPARLNEASVAPGEVGTFTFTIRNNNLSAGNYRLDVGLVADGITWFSANTHAYWDVRVP